MANYTNLNSAKLALGIAQGNSTYDAQINMFVSQANQLITEWLGNRDLTLQTTTELYKGDGQQWLVLNRRPVQLVQTTATLNGTISVTVQSAAGIKVGMPVCGTNPTPVNNPTSPAIVPGTTITAISGTTLTLSQAANVSGTQTLYFGMQVWLDEGAYWGQGASAFASNTALTPGVDFALDLDQSDGTSRSGLVYNINNFWPIPTNYTPGIITPVIGPPTGNIKIMYTAGYDPVPAQIQLAANLLVAKLRQISGFGQALESEKVKDYEYKLAGGGTSGIGLMTNEIMSLLAPYRNLAV